MNLLLRSHQNVTDPVWSVIFSIIILLIGVGYYVYTILNYDDGKNNAQESNHENWYARKSIQSQNLSLRWETNW